MTIDKYGVPDFTEDEIQKFYAEFSRKPDREKLFDEMRKMRKGIRKVIPLTDRMYFKEVMTKARREMHPAFHDIFEDPTLFRSVAYLTIKYLGELTMVNMLSISGIWIGPGCRNIPGIGTIKLPLPVSNYNYTEAVDIMRKYAPLNGVVYDYSCGWGRRLCAALSLGLKYLGTDTNPSLVEKLRECARDFAEANGESDITDIRCQGSETFVPEWEGKVGLAFSSPPYFDLENYVGEETSTNKFPTYAEWLSGYIGGTVRNVERYLSGGGYFLMNVNDTYYGDIRSLITTFFPDLEYVCDEYYNGGRRKRPNKRGREEKIMVFRKSL